MKIRSWKYSDTGINIKKIKSSQKDISKIFSSTFNNRKGKIGNILGEIGHYAGLIDIGRNFVLALHTDGVGTKVIIAQMMNKFDTIGIDCIAMNVNDLICLGAEPIAFLDYIALKKYNNNLLKEISKGLVSGANEASVSIIGGETAIMPDVIDGLEDKAFDLVGMILGVLNKNQIITGNKIMENDLIIGVESSGIHSNGFSLIRKLLLSKYSITANFEELDGCLGEELLKPTKIYVKPVLELLGNNITISGLAHITGGSFSKLTRLIKETNLKFRLSNMPEPPVIFNIIQKEGKISKTEMYRTFNMGIGFCLIASNSEYKAIEDIFSKYDTKVQIIGKIDKINGVFIDNIKIS